MAIIQAVFAALAHSAGKILNTIFAWATVLLFGRVTYKKQMLMSFACLGSVLWIVAVLGSIFPNVGLVLTVAFLPKTLASHRLIVRLAMLAAAIILPFLVGLSTLAGTSKQRPRLIDKVKQIAAGWPYTIGLSLTMMLMFVFAPILKLGAIVRRWHTQHVPVLIPTRQYPAAVDDVAAALKSASVHAERKQASWMVRFATHVLLFFARNQLQDVVQDLTRFVGDDFQIMLHPSDMIIAGKDRTVSRLRAELAEKLAFSHVSLTWSQEGNRLEADLKQIWLRVTGAESGTTVAILGQLHEAEKLLRRADLEYDEWQVLAREKAQIEHALLSKLVRRDLRRAS